MALRALWGHEANVLEQAARVAVRKSCMWTEYEDSQSDEFRRGVEHGACEIAKKLRVRVKMCQEKASVGAEMPETDPKVLREVEDRYADKFCRMCGAVCRPVVYKLRFHPETGKRVEHVRFYCTAKPWWSIFWHSGDKVPFPAFHPAE